MTYQIFYRNVSDGRAPECVFLLEEYEEAGKIDALSLRDLVNKLALIKDEESPLSNPRALRVGDVVRESSGQDWILTPLQIWAKVKVYETNS